MSTRSCSSIVQPHKSQGRGSISIGSGSSSIGVGEGHSPAPSSSRPSSRAFASAFVIAFARSGRRSTTIARPFCVGASLPSFVMKCWRNVDQVAAFEGRERNHDRVVLPVLPKLMDDHGLRRAWGGALM